MTPSQSWAFLVGFLTAGWAAYTLLDFLAERVQRRVRRAVANRRPRPARHDARTMTAAARFLDDRGHAR